MNPIVDSVYFITWMFILQYAWSVSGKPNIQGNEKDQEETNEEKDLSQEILEFKNVLSRLLENKNTQEKQQKS